MRIFHIATSADWAAAQKCGVYTRSTLARSLAEEGFIHAAYSSQWPKVLARHFVGVYEPLVLLEVDTGRLTSVVIEEQPVPGSEMICPHIYGPLNLDAVVSISDVTRPEEYV
ncbi:hypothetical protein Back2_04460 [Nocardioides baekrokdamisoli]|uniref:Glutathione S-transferase n=1 Tax=Nocardioides baekrokdamisoli TaxID=1804624 RepID=A0A3G9IZN2_9ACTN|nr:DUF952 domain-containing protein [Nocardioides baekrokdamisoli]BBH16159.1 hypothetical protein Back2_04460 [Nocardioides baekrokdamisoli]